MCRYRRFSKIRSPIISRATPTPSLSLLYSTIVLYDKNTCAEIDKFHNNRVCSKRGNRKILSLGDNEILSRSFAMPTHRRNKNPELSYHTFPKTAELKKKWIMAIQRDEGPTFKVTNNTVVCCAHFVPSDYAVGQRQSRLAEGLASSFNTTKRLKRLKNGAVPSLFSFRVVQAKIPRCTLIRYTGPLPVYGPPTYTQHLEEALKKADSELDKAKNEVVKAKNEVVKETAKVLELQQEQQLSYHHLVEQENLHKQTNRKGNSDLEYYTGFNADQFITCFNFLNPYHMITAEQAQVDNHVRSRGFPKHLLCLEDQFLLVLMRLRLNLFERDLSTRFNISEATVSRVFTRWINFMYLRLGLLPLWPSSVSVEKSMPVVSKEAYPTTFCIIDATELMCEVPASLCLQSQCYSSYKSHTTLKGQ